MTFDYQQICSGLLKGLPSKQREVLSRRFGLKNGRKETLESIGKEYGVTRERVRQIEKEGLLRLRPEIGRKGKVLECFKDYFKKRGGLKKEDLLLNELAGEKFRSQAYFLLTLGEDFQRIAEAADFYPFWTVSRHSAPQAKKIISSVYAQLKKNGKPLVLESLTGFSPSSEKAFVSFLEISKKIQKNPAGLYGLKTWPEINPRGIKDRAFIAFKEEERPLHFSEVARLIGPALPQTVHNELIKDPRFVLVGRGLYALSEWGYEKGAVRDIISKVLREAPGPLSREEVLERTLKQRLVKENTVLLNLSNRKYFLRTSGGRYQTKKA